MVMCVAQKIGPIKASLIHWNGTTGEDLRRARGARPSIGWHDPWRAELCDAERECAHGSFAHPPVLTKPSVLNDRNLCRTLPKKSRRELAIVREFPPQAVAISCLPARDAAAVMLVAAAALATVSPRLASE